MKSFLFGGFFVLFIANCSFFPLIICFLLGPMSFARPACEYDDDDDGGECIKLFGVPLACYQHVSTFKHSAFSFSDSFTRSLFLSRSVCLLVFRREKTEITKKDPWKKTA